VSERISSRTGEGDSRMSVFPTKILLATDGSNDAVLAARATADVSREVGSELYVVHVWQADFARAYAVTMPGVRYRWCEQQAERLLTEQVKLVEDAGGKVKEAHLRRGRVAQVRGPSDGAGTPRVGRLRPLRGR
jgi:hypothetical protein